MVRRTLLPRNVTRSTQLRGAQRSPELAMRSMGFRSPGNLIFPALADNSYCTTTLLPNGLSTLFIKGKPAFSNGPRSPPRNPLNSTILVEF